MVVAAAAAAASRSCADRTVTDGSSNPSAGRHDDPRHAAAALGIGVGRPVLLDSRPRRRAARERSRPMKALVTGASGFVGRHLVAHLEAVGRRGRSASTATGRRRHHRRRRRCTRWSHESRPEVIYHLAGWADVGGSWNAPVEAFRANAEGTLNVLRRATEAGVERVLAVSQRRRLRQGRPAELPLTEDVAAAPGQPLRRSKVAADYLGLQAWLGRGLPVLRVRAFNHLGPGQTDKFVAPALGVAHRPQRARGRRRRHHRQPVRPPRLHRRPRRGAGLPAARRARRAGRGLQRLLRASTSPCRSWPTSCSRWPSVPMRFETDPELLRPGRHPGAAGRPRPAHEATGWEPEIPIDQTLTDLLEDWRATRLDRTADRPLESQSADAAYRRPSAAAGAALDPSRRASATARPARRRPCRQRASSTATPPARSAHRRSAPPASGGPGRAARAGAPPRSSGRRRAGADRPWPTGTTCRPPARGARPGTDRPAGRRSARPGVDVGLEVGHGDPGDRRGARRAPAGSSPLGHAGRRCAARASSARRAARPRRLPGLHDVLLDLVLTRSSTDPPDPCQPSWQTRPVQRRTDRHDTSARSSPASPARTAPTSPSSCSTRATRSSAWSAGRSTVNFERIAHLQDRITFVPGDLLDEVVDDRHARRAPARRGLQPGRAVVRADLVRPAGAHRRDHRASASPASSTPSASSTRRSASTRRRRARCSARCRRCRRARPRRSTPARPTAWPRSTATGSRSTTARATTSTPSSGILFNHESPRRGLEFVTRKIIHTRRQDQARAGRRAAARQPRRPAGLGLRRRLRRGDVADAPAGRSPTTTWSPPARPTPVREFCEIAFGHVGLDWEQYVVVDERFFRPAEVDLLVGDPTKARDGARLEAEDVVRGARDDDGRRRPRLLSGELDLDRDLSVSTGHPAVISRPSAGGGRSRRRGSLRRPRAGGRRRPTSPPSPTSATTSSCTGSTSAPTSTRSPTRWPARSTPTPAGASPTRRWQAMEIAAPLRRRSRGSTSATATSAPTSTGPSGRPRAHR